MKKLTKDQRYYRKKRKDGQRDLRKVKREDGSKGVRVTRSPLNVKISQAAFQRLVEMSEEAGIKRWEMLTRILLKALPRYAKETGDLNPVNRYEWMPEELAIEFKDKVRYKGSTGDKQITYDITSTAANKLYFHKKATGLSKARIVQALILNYKPYSKEQLEKERLRREEDARQNDAWMYSNFENPYKHSKFINCGGGHIIHKKAIPMEHWDEAEWQEYEEIMEKVSEMNKLKLEQREKELEEFFIRNPFMRSE